MQIAKTKVINMFFTAIIIISASVFLGGCGSGNIAGIEISTQPPTKIKIDGKDAGMSPYKNRSIKAGLVDIKLGQEGIGDWQRQIELRKNISTVINWTFGKNDNYSGGYILSMEKIGGKDSRMIVSSSPAKASVFVGGEHKGLTPLFIANLSEGDREIKISMPGYTSLNLGVRLVEKYQIILEAIMAKEEKIVVATPTPLQTPQDSGSKIKIKTTDTGWLRVRNMPSSVGLEIDRVNPGEIYDSVGDSGEWTHIIVREKQGWVSSKWVEKI
ncbi:hypothetical protein CO009_03255 [Candidatus Shapirobacteria bacterium CG_4_8_14_3_um_filter_35_11]|uniref:PEGA domain-containing protein n=1 Tax=Candidatus Shapirobacteria bacterium CG_4_8_14_3_um_filter_35_11 TaxID=1974874 RepID=A0A2M8GJ61_9BACT|nr:MAG: hypothetical protein CO009_03255 [Candidatus Shapirobacteria bacterium CG_4_8_14_3_um_filter_35_11]